MAEGLTVLFPFLGAEMGGSHISGFTLAAALQADFGAECIVVAPEGSLILSEAARRGLGVRPSGEAPVWRRTPVYDALRLPARLRLLRETGAALIHCNDIAALQSWLGPAKVARKPVVYHHRALNRMIPPNSTLLRLADQVICISQECRRSVAFLPDAKASTVVNPFSIEMNQDRERLRKGLLEDLGFAAGTRLVGFIGNFWKRKRPEYFLEVCRLLAEARGDLGFILFGRQGDYSQADLQARAADLGIAERTRFAGFRLPVEANVAPLDVLLLTAVREPFGRTAVEALLLGVPYVATADAGHLEIADRWGGGRLAPLDAPPQAFAAEVLAALQDPGAALSTDRRRRVAEELSPAGHARRILEIYKRALPREA